MYCNGLSVTTVFFKNLFSSSYINFAHIYMISIAVYLTGLANRFEEYPKLRELIKLKDELIASTNIPPT